MTLLVGAVVLCPAAIRKDLERLFRESSEGQGQTMEMGQAYHRFKDTWTSLGAGLFQILSVDQNTSVRKHLLQFLYQETLSFLTERDSHATVLFTLYALYNTQPKRYFAPVPVIVTPQQYRTLNLAAKRLGTSDRHVSAIYKACIRDNVFIISATSPEISGLAESTIGPAALKASLETLDASLATTLISLPTEEETLKNTYERAIGQLSPGLSQKIRLYQPSTEAMLGPVTVNNDTGMAQAQSSQEKYRQALSFLRLSQEKVKEWESGRSETVSRRKKKSRRGTAQAPETLIREELGDEISMEMSQSQSSASISLSNMAVMDMPALPGMFQEYSDSQALFSADEDEE